MAVKLIIGMFGAKEVPMLCKNTFLNFTFNAHFSLPEKKMEVAQVALIKRKLITKTHSLGKMKPLGSPASPVTLIQGNRGATVACFGLGPT